MASHTTTFAEEYARRGLDWEEQLRQRAKEVRNYVNDIPITPLAIPMIALPKSPTNAIVMMEDADSFVKKTVLIGGAPVVMLLTYAILFSSSKLVATVGDRAAARE